MTAHSRIDAAIDRAVRDLMDAEPRGDLRARVLERVAGRGASGGRVFRPGVRWTWVLAPVAAAAAVVLAIALLQSSAPRVPHTSIDIVVRAPEPQPPVAPPAAQRDPQPKPSAVPRAAARERRAPAAVAAADDMTFSAKPPEGFAVVAALAPPAPIRVNTIADPAPSEPADLEIAPLHVAPLELNALPDTPQQRQE